MTRVDTIGGFILAYAIFISVVFLLEVLPLWAYLAYHNLLISGLFVFIGIDLMLYLSYLASD